MKYDKEFTDYKGEVFPYWEVIHEEGYSYGVSIEYAGRDGEVFICESGVHIEWDDSPMSWTDTNMVPKRMFPEMDRLGPEGTGEDTASPAEDGLRGQGLLAGRGA